jgi:predicted RNase H-like HicB family nuclease
MYVRKGRWFIYVSKPGLIEQGATLSDAERELLSGLAQ